MMVLHSVVSAVSLLVATSGPAPGATPPLLDCATVFTRTADEASLVKRFGRANVVAADLDGAEGSTERGTVVFPKDPTRRIEIFWHDTARRRRPATVRVRDTSAWGVRPAGSVDGAVALGTSLDRVAAVNGRPFTLSGFGWDMGGYAADWRGGALDAMDGGCSLSLRFDPDPKAAGRALDRVSGDRRLNSGAEAVKAVRPAVSEVALGWPE